MNGKYCFIIVGPTAAGKTAFAINLASHFSTEIISADSRQCYKELTIGVAKPSFYELQKVKHYFINTHSVQQQVNAKLFEAYANEAVEAIFKANDIAVVVGGTGLYISAFCNGIDHIPAVNEEVRNNVLSAFEKNGITWLQKEIEKQDPQYFIKGEIKNPQRIMRALEVKLSTGNSITEYQKQGKLSKPFTLIKIGLELPKEQLYQKINDRADAMMQQGLLEEVTGLLPWQKLTTLNTVGYTELFSYLNGAISLAGSVDKIKLNTRHYAKRQLTWFKKDKEVNWIDASTDGLSFINSCKKLINY